MNNTTPYAWLKPRSAAQIALEKRELMKIPCAALSSSVVHGCPD